MKKRTITLIVLLAILVILAALVCVGLVKSAEAHDAVYADYDAAVSAVEGAALAVIENGSTVGTYSLADLGVRDATLAAASAPYSAVDRMDADAFAPLLHQDPPRISPRRPPRTAAGWRSSPTGSTQAKSCPTCTPSAAPPPPTAHVEFKDGAYQIVPETQGSEIDDEAVTAALLATLSAEALPDLRGTSAEPQTAALVIDETLYIKPEITMDTVEYDPPALLAADLSGQTLDVHIGDRPAASRKPHFLSCFPPRRTENCPLIRTL